MDLTGYDLSRNFWNWAFENPEKIKPIHSAIFFFAIEHCNRLGGKEKFGFPSQMTMDAIGVKKYQTYGKALKDLEDWGFIEFIEKSKNQYSANIISISAPTKNGIARGKALDKATIKHGSKQSQSTGQGMDSINKPINQEPKTNKPISISEIEISDVEEKNKKYFLIATSFYKMLRGRISEIDGNLERFDSKKAKIWLDSFRLMIEVDKHSTPQLQRVYKFLQTDVFWIPNIQSPEKLRKQMDLLIAKSGMIELNDKPKTNNEVDNFYKNIKQG